ncbi:hypothetical protein FLL45_12615 [Aliikangiella marina]|uniref:DUF1579 domain-containing protein n=1 Tax=Aliikangiella marina TaxID=1712262 RepID=A0A545T943_9GAMM|nr:hypothetical protein [Aliikangiella marina]TQV73708.1 hypothetical protein FLL45_12615 [Aliikangiella marina]
MKKLLVIILLVSSAKICAAQKDSEFFTTLSSHCGKKYYGETIFPDDPSHDFAGEALEMHIKDCTDEEIRIPFKVGEDTSRTWIISKTDKGLLFKHDHRHKDGTPDEITMYGGYADDKGNTLSQNFPADDYTAQLIPAAKTNVWQLTFDPEKKQFIYYLERHQKPRYKAVFKIK